MILSSCPDFDKTGRSLYCVLTYFHKPLYIYRLSRNIAARSDIDQLKLDPSLRYPGIRIKIKAVQILAQVELYQTSFVRKLSYKVCQKQSC